MDLKSVKSVFLSFSGNLRSRISNPLGGAFAVSWLIWNWKIIYIFIRDNSAVQDKIISINKLINTDDILFIPLIASLVYIVFYPVIANGSHFIWSYMDKFTKTMASTWFKAYVPISKAEADAIYGLLASDKRDHDEQTSELKGQITALRKLVIHLEKTSDDDELVNSTKTVNTAPTNLYSFDRHLVKVFNSVNGKYTLNNAVAKILNKDINDQGHNNEINSVSAIFISMIASYPDTWTPLPIRVNGKNVDTIIIISYLRTLEILDLIRCSDITNKNDYEFTSIGIEFLTDTANNVKS
jgi:hypothetical protein